MEHKIDNAHQFFTMLDVVSCAVAPSKDARPVLSSVAIEWHAEGPLLVATESHVLLASGPSALIAGGFPPADDGVTVDLLAEPAKLLAWLKGELKHLKAADPTMTVEVSGRLSTWKLGDSIHVAQILDYAEFPKWRQLFSAHTAGEVGVFGLSSATLPIVVKAMGKLPKAGHDSVQTMTFTPGTSALKPLLLSAGGYCETSVRGLVMPVRLPD